MKRIAILMLTLSVFLSGCGFLSQRMIEPVSFYYLDEEYTFGQDSSVIVSEQREASGHRDDLSYMMALYLMGPTEEGHRSPIPRGTRIYIGEQSENDVKLMLSESALALSPEEFTLACACLTLTCLELTDGEQVTIVCGNNSIAMTRDSLTLQDDSAANTITEETQ